MITSTLLTYIITVTVFLIVPGPVNAMVVNAATQGGWKSALVAVVGTNTASLCLIAIAGLLLGSIISIAPQTFNLLSKFGGAYLIYYGGSLLRHKHDDNIHTSTLPRSPKNVAINAFFIGLSNPKDILFFTTFFPPFITQMGLGLSTSLLLLTIIWCLLDYSILLLYAIGIAKYLPSHIKPILNRLTALLFIAIGIYAIAS